MAYDAKFIPSVLVNDVNVDNDPFTASIVQNVTHGQLVFQSDGAQHAAAATHSLSRR